ncbi:hypothetical protein Tco_0882559, partial [Tanacetum coccineum]
SGGGVVVRCTGWSGVGYGDDGDVRMMMMMMVAGWWGWRWRVEARGLGDRIDRAMGMVFKNSPEKFSGGGATMVAGGWLDLAAGNERG